MEENNKTFWLRFNLKCNCKFQFVSSNIIDILIFLLFKSILNINAKKNEINRLQYLTLLGNHQTTHQEKKPIF